MAHPNDMNREGKCKVCGDKLTRIVEYPNGRLAFRRHRRINTCPTKGRGEPIRGS